MASEGRRETQVTDELLRDMLIVQLGLAGVAQRDIREIVAVDIHRVNRIVRLLRKQRKDTP